MLAAYPLDGKENLPVATARRRPVASPPPQDAASASSPSSTIQRGDPYAGGASPLPGVADTLRASGRSSGGYSTAQVPLAPPPQSPDMLAGSSPLPPSPLFGDFAQTPEPKAHACPTTPFAGDASQAAGRLRPHLRGTIATFRVEALPGEEDLPLVRPLAVRTESSEVLVEAIMATPPTLARTAQPARSLTPRGRAATPPKAEREAAPHPGPPRPESRQASPSAMPPAAGPRPAAQLGPVLEPMRRQASPPQSQQEAPPAPPPQTEQDHDHPKMKDQRQSSLTNLRGFRGKLLSAVGLSRSASRGQLNRSG